MLAGSTLSAGANKTREEPSAASTEQTAKPLSSPETTPRRIGDADQLADVLRERGQIPSAPEGVTDLAFSRIYRTPIGSQGLELTPETAALVGKKVRVLGFMVRQAKPSPGVALLAPFPLVTNELEYSLSDDLPVSTIFVDVPEYADIAVPHAQDPLLLTGRFETGPREEADGRVSHLRLVLDENTGAASSEARLTLSETDKVTAALAAPISTKASVEVLRAAIEPVPAQQAGPATATSGVGQTP